MGPRAASCLPSWSLPCYSLSRSSGSPCLWKSPSLLWPCGLWFFLPVRFHLPAFLGFSVIPSRQCRQVETREVATAITSPLGPRLGGMGRESTGYRGPASSGVGGGVLSPPSPQPLSAQPQFSLSSLPLPLSPTCLHSPNTRRLLSWVLSHPTHTGCPSSLPPASHRPAPQSPLPPRLMGARWPPGDSATGLWEPRHPAFPGPHTQLMLPSRHMEKGRLLEESMAKDRGGGAWGLSPVHRISGILPQPSLKDPPKSLLGRVVLSEQRP